MGDLEFKGKLREEFRRFGLARFMELGKAGMDGIGMVWAVGVLGPKVFPVDAVSKESIISNQAGVIKLEFRGEGGTLGADRIGGGVRLRG